MKREGQVKDAIQCYKSETYIFTSSTVCNIIKLTQK